MHANYFICLCSAKKFRHSNRSLREGGRGSTPPQVKGHFAWLNWIIGAPSDPPNLERALPTSVDLPLPPFPPFVCPTAVSDALWIFVCASFQLCPTLHSFRRCGCGCGWSGFRIGCIKDFMYADCVAHVNPFNSVIRNGKCHGNTQHSHSHSVAHTHTNTGTNWAVNNLKCNWPVYQNYKTMRKAKEKTHKRLPEQSGILNEYDSCSKSRHVCGIPLLSWIARYFKRSRNWSL